MCCILSVIRVDNLSARFRFVSNSHMLKALNYLHKQSDYLRTHNNSLAFQSQQTEAIVALMYPFEWHLPYVPVLPHDCARDFLDDHVESTGGHPGKKTGKCMLDAIMLLLAA